MATKTQSLELTIRHDKGVKGVTTVISCGAGLELWVTINQSGQTAKRWNLRYTDANGKRQKARIGSYPELSLAKARAEAEDLKAIVSQLTLALNVPIKICRIMVHTPDLIRRRPIGRLARHRCFRGLTAGLRSLRLRSCRGLHIPSILPVQCR